MKEIQHNTKRTPEVVDLPNLVEIQARLVQVVPARRSQRAVFRVFPQSMTLRVICLWNF